MIYQYNGEDEIDKNQVIKFLSNKNAPVFIELGAGHGNVVQDLIPYINHNGVYIAVEADPRNIRDFKVKNPRLLLINAAITNENKSDGNFYICTGINPYKNRPHYDASSLKHPTQETFIECPWLDYENVTVPYITLNMFIEKQDSCIQYNLKNIDFIWCDVEGATREVIEGGQKTLAITEYFYTEVKEELAYSYEGEAMYDEILKLMNAEGFELVQKFKHDALFRNINLT